jgi:hypothetical protein
MLFYFKYSLANITDSLNKMVDIEPMLTYDYSNFGINQIYGGILLLYFALKY